MFQNSFFITKKKLGEFLEQDRLGEDLWRLVLIIGRDSSVPVFSYSWGYMDGARDTILKTTTS